MADSDIEQAIAGLGQQIGQLRKELDDVRAERDELMKAIDQVMREQSAMAEVARITLDRAGNAGMQDGAAHRLGLKVEEIDHRLADLWPPKKKDESTGGCEAGDVTTLAAGSGATASSNTYTATGSGLVKVTLTTRPYWDSTADVLRHFTVDLTVPACAISAETRHDTDTPGDCP